MSRQPIKITAANRTKTIKEWFFETGLAISTIESRRKRHQTGQVNYSPEEIVGLVKIKQPCYKPDHRINPKPPVSQMKEKNLFQIRNKFCKKSLL